MDRLTHTYREIDRQTHIHRDRHTHICTHIHGNRKTHRHSDGQMDTYRDRHIHIDTHTQRQKDRHIHRDTHTHTHRHKYTEADEHAGLREAVWTQNQAAWFCMRFSHSGQECGIVRGLGVGEVCHQEPASRGPRIATWIPWTSGPAPWGQE